jgi:hypothetical protein
MIIRITKYNVEQITTYPLDHELRLAIRVISKGLCCAKEIILFDNLS